MVSYPTPWRWMQADHDQSAGARGIGSRLDEVALAGEGLEDVEDVAGDD